MNHDEPQAIQQCNHGQQQGIGIGREAPHGQVRAGEQRLSVRMNDDARHPGFAYQKEAVIRLAPAQILVIDFDAENGGITLK